MTTTTVAALEARVELLRAGIAAKEQFLLAMRSGTNGSQPLAHLDGDQDDEDSSDDEFALFGGAAAAMALSGGALEEEVELDEAVILRTLEVAVAQMAPSVPPSAMGHALHEISAHLCAGRFFAVLESAPFLRLESSEDPASLADAHTRLREHVRAFLLAGHGGLVIPSNVSHAVMTGAALLSLFLQANWTGPPLDSEAVKTWYPVPIIGHSAARGEGEAAAAEQLSRAQEAAKAAAAATGKNTTAVDVDGFPALHALCARELEASGVTIFTDAKYLHYLLVARIVLDEAAKVGKSATARWWRARCATAHQESLDGMDVADALRLLASDDMEATMRLLGLPADLDAKPDPAVHDVDLCQLAARLWLERGMMAHKFADVLGAKNCFHASLQWSRLSVRLTGAPGKRTKFQHESKSQLLLLASSSTTESAAEVTAPSDVPEQPGPVPKGMTKVTLEELDEHTPLRESILFTDSPTEEEQVARTGRLTALDQCTVLALCVDVKNSYAMEALTGEQMGAYVARVLQHPVNWMVYSTGLLIKSQLEFERYKTKERSVLQMQVLVDQQSDRLTPLQSRQREVDDSAPVQERLSWLFALSWPAIWGLRRMLGRKYLEMGVAASALELFLDAHLWEEVSVFCIVNSLCLTPPRAQRDSRCLYCTLSKSSTTSAD